MRQVDVAIVGAGIAGLSLAWHLQRAGKNVLVLEKSGRAEGASVKNFGMIWAVGQPDVNLESLALRSRDLWMTAAEDLGFWIRTSGSLHLAYEPLELKVLQEYVEGIGGAYERRIIEPEETLQICPPIRRERLLGALHSPTEAGVDPREVVGCAADALVRRGVDIRFDSPVARVSTGKLRLADGNTIEADQIVVCPGPDLHSMFPDAYRTAGLIECRLQMLRLVPRESIPPLGIHVCAGLTLGHYKNFNRCASLPELLAQHREKWARQVQDGIHVLVSEQPDGSLTVGDSHAYGRSGPIYRDEAIDDAILDALDEFLPIENYAVSQRWTGCYNTHSTMPLWVEEIKDSVWALNLFGTGMTLSFAVTELLAQKLIESHD